MVGHAGHQQGAGGALGTGGGPVSGPVASTPSCRRAHPRPHPGLLTRPSARASRRCAAFARSQVSFQRSAGRPSSVSNRCSSWGTRGKLGSFRRKYPDRSAERPNSGRQEGAEMERSDQDCRSTGGGVGDGQNPVIWSESKHRAETWSSGPRPPGVNRHRPGKMAQAWQGAAPQPLDAGRCRASGRPERTHLL